ncbi:hypothetical protein ABVT39_022252 [Epinephelus coioides]
MSSTCHTFAAVTFFSCWLRGPIRSQEIYQVGGCSCDVAGTPDSATPRTSKYGRLSVSNTVSLVSSAAREQLALADRGGAACLVYCTVEHRVLVNVAGRQQQQRPHQGTEVSETADTSTRL